MTLLSDDAVAALGRVLVNGRTNVLLMNGPELTAICTELLALGIFEVVELDAATLLPGMRGIRLTAHARALLPEPVTLTRQRFEELCEKERGYDAMRAQSEVLYGPDGDMGPGGPIEDEDGA